MSDENQNDNQSLPAADPAEDHLTPGGNPAQDQGEEKHASSDSEVETVLETPGGTTVTESPSEGSSE